MATQTTALYDIMQKHQKADYRQYNASHRYRKWMGRNQAAIIQRVNGLETDGESVRIHFTDDLTRRNIGTGKLDGNEQTFGTDYYDLIPIWQRDAVKLKKSDAKKAYTNQAAIQRRSVRTWAQNTEYMDIVDAMEAVAFDPSNVVEEGTPDGSVMATNQQKTFLEASEAERDAFLAANADRLAFGASDANVVAGDMSASLLNLTSGTDTMGVAFLSRLKRLARKDEWATGGVRPIRPVSSEEGGRDFFKVVVGQDVFEDLVNDEDMKRYNTDARLRGVENHPIFQDGDLVYRGMIICEDVRLPTYAGLGAGGADVAPVHLLGAQALGAAIGQRLKYTKSDNRDYAFYDGVGVERQQSFEKLFYRGGARAGKVHGMVTGYVAL